MKIEKPIHMENRKTKRVLFSTSSGYYVISAGKSPYLYKGKDLQEAIRVFNKAKDKNGE